MKKIIFTLIALTTVVTQCSNPLIFLCTAALIDNQAEMRQMEYEQSLKKVRSYGYLIYIVEAIKQKGPTFLDKYADTIYYSTVNNPHLKNKGVNEARSCKQALDHFDIDDEIMIVRMTGRYLFMSDQFMEIVAHNRDYDGFIKPIDNNTQYFTGCFALKAQYLKEFLLQLDCDRLEREMINVEKAFKDYIDSKNLKIYYVDHLDLKVNSFGVGNCQLMMY